MGHLFESRTGVYDGGYPYVRPLGMSLRQAHDQATAVRPDHIPRADMNLA
jgi:hypothetical protein